MSNINLDLQASHKMLMLLDEANANTESVRVLVWMATIPDGPGANWGGVAELSVEPTLWLAPALACRMG